MRALSWMQNKLYGKEEKKRTNTISVFTHYSPALDDRKEEFEDDWPQTLLAIGTFGEDKMEEDTTIHEPVHVPQTSQNPPEFTLEEISDLLQEPTKLSTEKWKNSFDDEHTVCTNIGDDLGDGNDDDDDLSIDAKITLTRAKDLLANKKSGIGKTSLKFLLKKMFLCHSGFLPAPSLIDPLRESRIEKIFKAMIQKKVYPQSSAQPSTKKWLEKKQTYRVEDTREKEKAEEASKWVRTDSEYIVLEM